MQYNYHDIRNRMLRFYIHNGCATSAAWTATQANVTIARVTFIQTASYPLWLLTRTPENVSYHPQERAHPAARPAHRTAHEEEPFSVEKRRQRCRDARAQSTGKSFKCKNASYNILQQHKLVDCDWWGGSLPPPRAHSSVFPVSSKLTCSQRCHCRINKGVAHHTSYASAISPFGCVCFMPWMSNYLTFCLLQTCGSFE